MEIGTKEKSRGNLIMLRLMLVVMFYLIGQTMLMASVKTSAVQFSGSTSSYISCGTSSNFNLTGSLTLEAWVYPTARTNAVVAGKLNHVSSGYGYELEVWGDGKAYFA